MQPSATFVLAGHVVQPTLNRVLKRGTAVQVEPKVMQVLLCLSERPGEVVTKEDLIRRVWAGLFVSDDVLTRAVGELRKIFEDNPDGPRVIETIRKRGYRLVGALSPERGTLEAGGPRRASWRLLLVTGALLLAAFGLSRWGRRSSPRWSPRFSPVTSLVGNEYDPSVSPDGTRVVFAWDGGKEGPTRLYVKLLGSDTMVPLTEGGNDRVPVWSADGTRVAFVRSKEGRCEIDSVSALGGGATYLAPCGDPEHSRFALTPDGGSLVVARRGPPESPLTHLAVVDLTTSSSRDLTPEGDYSDMSPALSPDGESVAFVRELSDSVGDIYAVPLKGGRVQRLTADNADILGLAWIEAGTRLAFSSNRGGMFSLWSTDRAGSEPELLAGGGRRLKHPSSSHRGNRLVYESWNYDINLWQGEVRHQPGGAPAGPVAPASDEWTFEARYSPDGSRIAFASTRSGNCEIWVSAADGTGARRLTSFGGGYVGLPRWSRDGRELVFVARPKGQADVYVQDASGGPARRLLSASDAIAPSFSSDGQAVYYGSRKGGHHEIYRYAIPSGDEKQVTRGGGYAALESLDSEWLYFSRIERPGLFRQRTGGGEAETVTERLLPSDFGAFGIVEGGVYWIERDMPDADPRLVLLRSGSAREIARVHDLAWPGVEVSGDGTHFLYARLDHRESNLVLLSLRAPP